MNTPLDPQLTGNVGLYYCCYRLSLLGWNVMPTARNARAVDIIAYSRDASRFVGVQVKALSKRNPVPLGASLEKVMGDYWVIINRVATMPTAYVMLPSEVLSLAHRGEKEGSRLLLAPTNGLLQLGSLTGEQPKVTYPILPPSVAATPRPRP